MNGEIALNDVTEAIFAGFPPLSRHATALETGSETVPAVGLRALQANGSIQMEELDLVRPPTNKRVPHFQLQRGDVLVAVRGSLEKSAVIGSELKSPVYATANVAVIRSKKELLDSFYLWAWFQRLEAFGGLGFRRATTGQLTVSASELLRLKINLPPLAVQRKIGLATQAIWECRLRQQELMAQYERTFRAFLGERIPLGPLAWN
jgi:hypothetical protein